MCSNYRPVTRSDRLLSFFGVERARDEDPVDVWPTGLAPFIRLAGSGTPDAQGGAKLIVDDGHFGLLPGFQAELAAGRRTYNARSETVHRLPSFRESWARGWRCVIPAEWIYEPHWDRAKADGGRATRWRVQRKNGWPLAIAGIWREWTDPTGHRRLTFAMLTVNADGHPVMGQLHEPGEEKRMVVLLDEDQIGHWLSCPVAQASQYFRAWTGDLEAVPDPLPGRAPRALASPAQPPSGKPPSGKAPPAQGGLF